MTQAQVKMSPQDESTWFKVRIALKVDVATENIRDRIKIHVNRDASPLEGTLPSAEAVQDAERVVLGVAEVLGVTNNLKIG